MKLHLPQFRWPFRSTADRYAKDYLAEERSGSGMRAWSLASCHLAIVNDRLEAKRLEQRLTELEEGQEDLERGAHGLILLHIKAWHSPSLTDSPPGPTTSETAPSSLSDASQPTELTQIHIT